MEKNCDIIRNMAIEEEQGDLVVVVETRTFKRLGNTVSCNHSCINEFEIFVHADSQLRCDLTNINLPCFNAHNASMDRVAMHRKPSIG